MASRFGHCSPAQQRGKRPHGSRMNRFVADHPHVFFFSEISTFDTVSQSGAGIFQGGRVRDSAGPAMLRARKPGRARGFDLKPWLMNGGWPRTGHHPLMKGVATPQFWKNEAWRVAQFREFC